MIVVDAKVRYHSHNPFGYGVGICSGGICNNNVVRCTPIKIDVICSTRGGAHKTDVRTRK
jgi:hypothetical protein